MATVVGHRLLRKDSLETVEKPVCYRYAADMLSICFRYAFGVLLENRNPTAWAIQSERDLPASSLCHARSVFQKVIRISTLNTCAAFVAWTNTHVQIQSKAFFSSAAAVWKNSCLNQLRLKHISTQNGLCFRCNYFGGIGFATASHQLRSTLVL